MVRYINAVAALEASRLTAGIGAVLVLLVLGGWAVGVANGSALKGQVVAAVVALLISAAGLLYAFRLGPSPASE